MPPQLDFTLSVVREAAARNRERLTTMVVIRPRRPPGRERL
ncbi:MAG TPA: hypothetical protein VMS17_30735 [Gemmataceae bacterium]|nr:hypothetical protein [Gemmataceae bacterium]